MNVDYLKHSTLPNLIFLYVQDNYNPKFVGLNKYGEFLNTKYWNIISRYLRKNINMCQFLYYHNNKYLEIHHRTYDILGKELQNLNDLLCLCQECHKTFHNKEINQLKHDSEYISRLKLENLNKLLNHVESINQIEYSINPDKNKNNYGIEYKIIELISNFRLKSNKMLNVIEKYNDLFV